ncbi:unnamed protein product [Rotaria magnacalcarata]|uniref:Lipoprotein n=2 Tax=Rotaria magnacalcarata TaxID=392030 RepID=A0A816WQL4_9BILA|nr:unnamed protein product [Rotaria magnacalcarata]CAF1526472.1 unnamed protein product [Rotaria magnacalcarata]CAF2085632.1 unnamed protein product [Rotaria magnacalcarata]CAF2097266.1 unnamed protein product [Rotaria magnacalcarata]CAF2137211.1 unnamed protein product [Rotaria magnacalcarata]
MLQLLLLCILSLVSCQTPAKTYYIRKDYFHGLKPGEFTVYNPTGKTTYYRIESHYGILHSLELISYPSKIVVGKLKAKLSLLLYKAELDIFDNKSQRWINGTIDANFQLFESRFTIQWNGRRLIMVSDAFSLITRFYDEQQPNIILAKFRKRFESYLFVNKFDMEIFVNDLPDSIFLLGLAVKDRNRRTHRKT